MREALTMTKITVNGDPAQPVYYSGYLFSAAQFFKFYDPYS